jgi:hypothetical protein
MHLACIRSHDGFVANKNGILEPSPGSKYASQQTVFNDLGRGVLKNAFEGKSCNVVIACNSALSKLLVD